MAAVKEARKSAWAGTGGAAICTANNGTSAGVPALVRTRWHPKPFSTCTDEAGVLCRNPRLAERVIRVTSRDILLLTAYFEHSVGFRIVINANLMHDVCLLPRDRRLPFILGADFNFPTSLLQDSSLHGGSLWIQKLGVSVVTPVGSTHTCRNGRSQKPDTIDCFLVSTRIRPLLHNCEVLKSVHWGAHYGVRITLNADFKSVVVFQLTGAYNKRRNHDVKSLHDSQVSHRTKGDDSARWEEGRRSCVFVGRQLRCQDGQEVAKMACSQCANAVGFLEEANELGHALETWSDTAARYWAGVGRQGRVP